MTRLAGWILGLALAMIASPVIAQTAEQRLTGRYDGGQMEIAAGLELQADGRFRYGLSYGAVDEEAAGTWRVADGQVMLTSDPVVPPRFVVLGQQARAGGGLRVTLDVPGGMSRQYFKAELRLPGGAVDEQQLNDENAPLGLAPGEHPTVVTLTLPMFELRSAPVPLAGGGGHELHIRFEPNDLGKVAFAQTPLRNDGGDLILQRYDRTLRFRRVAR